MPNISAAVSPLPESPIRKLAPYAVEAEKDKDIHLNIGQPDLPSPQTQ